VQIESLVCAGAADPLGTPRSALLAAVAGCVSDYRRAAPGQASLFDEVEDAFALPAVPAWGVVEQLRREEDALGFYLSGHPLDAVPAPVRYVGTPLDAMPADGDVVVLGVVSDLKAAVTKSGKKFARFRVASRAGSVEVVCWPDELANVAHLLTDGAVLAVRGAAESRGDRPSLVLRAAATNPAAFATEAHILLDPIQHAPQDIDRIVPILRAAPGRVPVFLTVRDGSGRRAVLGTDVAVDPARLDIAATVAVVGSDYFRLR
jgi:DNA polymerase-3 subunit alpha